MKNLVDALERMREANEDFNGSMTDLDQQMRSLRARMVAFDRKMEHLGRNVGYVGDQSRSLVAIMDRAISNESVSQDDPVIQRAICRIGAGEKPLSKPRSA